MQLPVKIENLSCSYCQFAWQQTDESDVNRVYHHTQYGFPVVDDNALFGRLILEINQAGLSWTTILRKADNFKKAFDDYSVKKIAQYGDADKQRLLQNAGIIRNRRKIDAVIYNANVLLNLQRNFGSFKNWIDMHHPLNKKEWTMLFRKTFKFTGEKIVEEFLMSTGYLEGAHGPLCPVYHKILALNPPWYKSK